jgi:hypothetical protein
VRGEEQGKYKVACCPLSVVREYRRVNKTKNQPTLDQLASVYAYSRKGVLIGPECFYAVFLKINSS